MLKGTISKSASQAVAECRGFFQAKTGPRRLARCGRIEKLKNCPGKMDARTQRRGPGAFATTARNVNSRGPAAQTPRHHAGKRAISRRWLSRKAPRRSLLSDARWRSTETGTRNTGISTSGNRLTSSFGSSKANSWNGKGTSRIPPSPRRRDRQAQIGSTRRPGRHSRAAHAGTLSRRPGRERR